MKEQGAAIELLPPAEDLTDQGSDAPPLDFPGSDWVTLVSRRRSCLAGLQKTASFVVLKSSTEVARTNWRINTKFEEKATLDAPKI